GVPGIGGGLTRGDRGPATSPAVRALARLLPDHQAVEGCPYRCDPATPSHYCDDCRRRAKSGPLPVTRLPMRIVELPINASEDRLVGSIDIEAAVRAGTRRFHPDRHRPAAARDGARARLPAGSPCGPPRLGRP